MLVVYQEMEVENQICADFYVLVLILLGTQMSNECCTNAQMKLRDSETNMMAIRLLNTLWKAFRYDGDECGTKICVELNSYTSLTFF